MSSAGISFGGLASGLDTKAIIAALMGVEQQPINALQFRKTSLSTQKSLFGDLGTLLASLQTAANSLKLTTDFLAMKAASDNENVLTASASNSAVQGSHQIEVLDLAQAQVNSSNGRADHDVTQYQGTINISYGGNDHLINIPATPGGSTTLDGVAAAINNTADLDVVASVVNTGNATNPYQLVLRSSSTGSAGQFDVALETESGGGELTALVNDLHTNIRTPAKDAHILLNGIDIFRSSNTIADAIPGVTLNLKSKTAANTPVTVTVSTDTEATTQKVQTFIDAYNKVVDFVKKQNELDATGHAKNLLFGDMTLQSIRNSLRSAVGAVVDSGNAAYSMFAQLGINSDRDGKLTLDSAKFSAALAADPDAVGQVFAKSGTGIAAKLYTQIGLYTDSVDGLLKARSDGFDTLIKDTQNQIDQGTRRLDQFQKALEQKYANLESLLAKLQGQGSALGSFTAPRSG
ncbi:MAG TPA: flagellar filament capping protein FliD [Planctomycetota bacterium]|nr:flagellar filament capping protein FliD [Planctomycetota bacterium]